MDREMLLGVLIQLQDALTESLRNSVEVNCIFGGMDITPIVTEINQRQSAINELENIREVLAGYIQCLQFAIGDLETDMTEEFNSVKNRIVELLEFVDACEKSMLLNLNLI